MRRLRLQFIISIILLFLPAAMVLAGFNRPGVSTLALLWLVIGGYWLIRFFLNPMEKLWKTMRALIQSFSSRPIRSSQENLPPSE